MDGDNFSYVKDVSAMGIGGSSYINLIKYGDVEGSYCSFLTHPHFDYSDSYSDCSLALMYSFQITVNRAFPLDYIVHQLRNVCTHILNISI